MAIERVAIVGLGLIGSSVARAVKERLPQVTVVGHDAKAEVRDIARELGFCDIIVDAPAAAVADAALVTFAVPVAGMADAARAVAPGLRDGVIISDVGSSKTSTSGSPNKAEAMARRCFMPNE